MVNNCIYTYNHVSGDSLRNINAATKKLWDDAVSTGVNDIIDISEGDNKQYLVDTILYHNLIQASEEGFDKDPYGIPNVNFTLIDKTDNRWEEYQKQRLERGFDNSELWSLDSTITKFILPRLKAFEECTCGYPGNMEYEEWHNILKRMIKAFEYLDNEDLGCDNDKTVIENCDHRNAVIKEGLELFAKYYCSLWD